MSGRPTQRPPGNYAAAAAKSSSSSGSSSSGSGSAGADDLTSKMNDLNLRGQNKSPRPKLAELQQQQPAAAAMLTTPPAPVAPFVGATTFQPQQPPQQQQQQRQQRQEYDMFFDHDSKMYTNGTGFFYDEQSGMYYDAVNQYDDELGVYFHPHTGQFFDPYSATYYDPPPFTPTGYDEYLEDYDDYNSYSAPLAAPHGNTNTGTVNKLASTSTSGSGGRGNYNSKSSSGNYSRQMKQPENYVDPLLGTDLQETVKLLTDPAADLSIEELNALRDTWVAASRACTCCKGFIYGCDNPTCEGLGLCTCVAATAIDEAQKEDKALADLEKLI